MELSKKVVSEWAGMPGFRDVVDMLIDAGMLAARWTMDDLVGALQTARQQYEVLQEFATHDADTDEALFQHALVRRVVRNQIHQEWRAIPHNRESERQRDQKRHKKAYEKQKREKRAAHVAFLEAQRKEARAALRARLQAGRGPGLTSVKRTWENQCNAQIA